MSGGDVSLSMNTYIYVPILLPRAPSFRRLRHRCRSLLESSYRSVVLCLNLFYMDANENKRRRTDIPSWIDDASSLEKIQVRFASRSTCLAWTVSRSSTRSKWHIRTMNTSTRSVRRPSMISVTGPVSSLLERHTNIPFS